MRMVFLVILILSVFSGVSFANGNVTIWQTEITGIIETIDVHAFGPFDVSRDWSHEYVGERRAELYTHSIQANAPGGESDVFNVLISIPVVSGNRFWSGTHIGYDSLDTGGQLTGSESGGVTVCEDGTGSAVGMGWSGAISQGAIHSNMRVSPSIRPKVSYDFSSGVQGGEMSVGMSAMSASGDSTGVHSQMNYNQSIHASGDFNIRYSADYMSGGHSPLCPW